MFAIDREIFEQKTNCPQCDNPVRILGFYKKIKKRPHGIHVFHSVPGIASYSQEGYDCCPYARKTLQKDARKQYVQGLPTEILNLLKEQFDRIVYVLSKDVDFRFSEKLLRRMLKTYLGEQGHLYTGATLNNLPWIFGYMSDAQPLVWQWIRKDSPLHTEIRRKCKDAEFRETKSNRYVQLVPQEQQFLKISFCFIHHRSSILNDEVKETLKFSVFRGKVPDPEILYEKTIEIGSAFFLNLIHLSPERSQRNELHLAIATDMLGVSFDDA